MNPELVARVRLRRTGPGCAGRRRGRAPGLDRGAAHAGHRRYRVHGLDPDWWHTRWIHGPLRAIRLIEGLRLKFMVELDEVRQQLRDVEAELSLLREAGRIADAEFASRKAVRLLCHEADVRARLDAPVANRITAARNGIARILEVSLRYAGRELLPVGPRKRPARGRSGRRPGGLCAARRPTTASWPRRIG